MTPPEQEPLPNKLRLLLGSIRFWQVTIGATAEALLAAGVIPEWLGHSIAGWLAAVAVIGTIDRFTEQ